MHFFKERYPACVRTVDWFTPDAGFRSSLPLDGRCSPVPWGDCGLAGVRHTCRYGRTGGLGAPLAAGSDSAYVYAIRIRLAVRWSTAEFAMTQTTDEHNFEPGFYVIGIFDVLGQRSRLVEPITFPPRTDDETEAVVRDLSIPPRSSRSGPGGSTLGSTPGRPDTPCAD